MSMPSSLLNPSPFARGLPRRGRVRAVILVSLLATWGSTPAAEPLANLAQIIDQGAMPLRVHVFEDYETDIERRWWLAGQPTEENVPESLSAMMANTRCCRASETKNFDRQRADQATIWKGVVFNPVPGPPMGSNTRLSFRYRLQGTDALRVQLFTLSKGYHRYLMLAGLPQGKWQSATVDMTVARQPGGGGGPLAEDERIDDIQFYIPQESELWIDDIVLYEAAPAGETRPFPKRVIFTGWFDTGKQGQEWPGDFEIVLHEKPLTWDAARSVTNAKTDTPWIRLSLRGMRPLSRRNEVRFRYHLTGSEELSVVLDNSKTGRRHAARVSEVKPGQWREATVSLPADEDRPAADELHFLTGPGGVLLVDDVLLYEPGDLAKR